MMTTSRTLRLLVLGASVEQLDTIRQTLAESGFAPEIECSSTLSGRPEVSPSEWDLVIVSDRHLDQSIVDAVRALAVGRDATPIIAICSRDTIRGGVEAMRAGARDFVVDGHFSRLGPAVERELEDAKVRRDRIRAELALAESEQRYRAVVDDQTEFVIRWTPDGTRRFVNRAYCDYFGGAAADFVGSSFMSGMGEGDREFLDGFLTALTPEQPVATAEPRIIRPDGEIAFHEWVNRGIFDADGRLVEIQSVGRDVTERRTAAEAERQQMLLVEVLRDTSAALNSTLDLDEVFDRILANIGWVIPHNASAIFFAEGNAARVVRQRGWEDQGIFDIPELVPLTETEVQALSQMMSAGSPIVIQDTVEDDRWNPGTRRLAWVRSFAAAPLFDESSLSGVLALFCDRPNYFTETHLELLKGFASQAASASRNARLFETVSTSRRQLRELSVQIVNAQEDERQRISKELHDGVAQTLTGVIINAELLLTKAGGQDDDPVFSRLREVAALAKQSLGQIRDLSHRLRPAMLDELGLAPTLRWFADRFAGWSNIDVECRTDDIGDDRFDSPVETALYRVVQESLNNLALHSKAETIEIETSRSPTTVTLTIESTTSDSGFSPGSSLAESVPELDLLGMKERVAAVGGELAIEPTSHGGVRIRAEAPIHHRDA